MSPASGPLRGNQNRSPCTSGGAGPVETCVTARHFATWNSPRAARAALPRIFRRRGNTSSTPVLRRFGSRQQPQSPAGLLPALYASETPPIYQVEGGITVF